MSASGAGGSVAPGTSKGRTSRLHFLDGLRGLAAAYVVLFHEVMINDSVKGELSRPVAILREWLNHGHFAVILFIVLSGFSLTIPAAKSADRQLPGGLRSFVRRRARRILPPYYAALALSMILLFASSVLQSVFHLEGKAADGALGLGPVLSHILLVHNFTFDWAYRINAPMWTIATEWQIYFVFALALLPLWRRTGTLVVLASAWILGLLPYFLLPPNKNFFWACPWFLGSFALGMVGAIIQFSPAMENSWWRRTAPWPLLTAVTFGGVVWMANDDRVPYPVVHLVVSLFAFCLISACTVLSRREEPGIAIRMLKSRPISALGGFSYSLYLIQHPILKLAERGLLSHLPISKDANLLLQVIILTPALMAVAWLFAELFEKPFTTGRAPIFGRPTAVAINVTGK